jgi:hypothetical protein
MIDWGLLYAVLVWGLIVLVLVLTFSRVRAVRRVKALERRVRALEWYEQWYWYAYQQMSGYPPSQGR